MKSKFYLFFILFFINSSLIAQKIQVKYCTNNQFCDATAEIKPQYDIPGQIWTFKQVLYDTTIVIQYGISNKVENLCEGSYILSYTDSNGINYQESFYTGKDSCFLTASFSSWESNDSPLSCNGMHKVFDIKSSTPYDIEWLPGIDSHDSIQTSICAGFYSCRISQKNGCSKSISFGFSVGLEENFPQCSYLKATYKIINTTSPNKCDGSVTIFPTGGKTPYLYTINRTDTLNKPSFSPTFDNLCGMKTKDLLNNYNITIQDDSGCAITKSISIYDSTLIGYIDLNNATDSCNGNVASVSILGGIPPYTYQYSNGDTTKLTDSLCIGSYTLKVTDSLGTSLTLPFNIYLNTNQTLSAYILPNSVSADSLCDGKTNVIVTGGTLPYTYLYSNGENTKNADSLCGGLNTLMINDSDHNKIQIHFITPSPSNSYSTIKFLDSLIVDTLFSNSLIDCNFNYDIDSAKIISYDVLQNNTIKTTWVIYYGDSTKFLKYTYFIDQTFGVYDVILTVFCPDKSKGKYLYLKDRIYYNGQSMNNSLQLVDNEIVNYKIYPNPFENQVYLSFTDFSEKELIVTDLFGKEIFKKKIYGNEYQLETSFIRPGHYIFEIRSDNYISISKLVRK